MIFKVHYEVNGYRDWYDIEGNDINELLDYIDFEMEIKGATLLGLEEI